MDSNSFNSQMLILARESRGITQKELVEKLSIEQGTISKIENGLLSVNEDLLQKLSKVLSYPMSFFFQKDKLFNPTVHFYRKRVSIPGKVLKKAEARMNISKMNLDRLLTSVDLTNQNLISWNVDLDGSPEKAAQYLRSYWNIPKGPISNLVRLAEDHGIIVTYLDLDSEKLDGLSVFTDDNHPIIFLNDIMPNDRKRITLAHEIGHLVMHFGKKIGKYRDIEDEAWEFAAEFLMPKKEIFEELIRPDLSKLLDLKKYWKVSMRAIVVRARKLNTITQNQYKYLLIKMNKEYGAKSEPYVVPEERPSLIQEMINLHYEGLGYTENELSSFLSINVDELKEIYFNERKNLRILQS